MKSNQTTSPIAPKGNGANIDQDLVAAALRIARQNKAAEDVFQYAQDAESEAVPRSAPGVNVDSGYHMPVIDPGQAYGKADSDPGTPASSAAPAPGPSAGAGAPQAPETDTTEQMSTQQMENFQEQMRQAQQATEDRRSEPEDGGYSPGEVNALFLDAFFAELERCGVTDYVVSPGSRSTALAMKAYERFTDVYVHVDERGAAYFALGLAKAKRSPVAVICTSGSAVGNWMPAVLEAESSRVPLLLLSADRPQRLQHVGAPQTCDQLKMFGDHVKKFVQMPEPSAEEKVLSYVRQIALESCIAAHGAVPSAQSCDGGPVHLNFPFDEPLLPSPQVEPDRPNPLPPTVVAGQNLLLPDVKGILRILVNKRTIALCGEGAATTPEEAEALVAFAHKRNIPLIADPLSGLRNSSDPFVIDAYTGMDEAEIPPVDVAIRLGRWPIDKRICQIVQSRDPMQVAVDMRDTRDMSSSTSLFVHTLPVVLAVGLRDAPTSASADERSCTEWLAANHHAADRIKHTLLHPRNDFEGAYLDKLLGMAPDQSLVFCANSMSIRTLDRYYRKSGKTLTVLANRGLNGIDGTLSTALGAAQEFEQTTLVTGDLALLHDLNAFAFQNEMRVREMAGDSIAPSVVVVLLNNNGGAIFDILPQKSEEAYFERLFLTPQNVVFRNAAGAFGVSYVRAETLSEFHGCYAQALGKAGITLIEVPLPLAGVADRYALG